MYRLGSLIYQTVLLPIALMGYLFQSCNTQATEPISIISNPLYEDAIVLAQSFELNEEIDSSLVAYLRAKEIADSLGGVGDKAYVNGQIGRIYLYKKGNIREAEKFLISQRNLLESYPELDTTGRINNYLDLAFLYFKKLDLPFAESYAYLAYQVVDESNIKDSLLISEIYASIGLIKFQMLDTNSAKAMYSNAARYFPLPFDVQQRIPTWVKGMVSTYVNFGPADSAALWLEKFHKASIGQIQKLAEYEYFQSIFYYLRDEYKAALLHARKSADYYRLCRNPDPYKSVHTYELISTSLQYLRRYDEALIYADSTLSMKFGENYTITSLESDIYSLNVLSLKAEILADQGVALSDTSRIMMALKIYEKVDTLLSSFTKLDVDGFLYNKYYNNFLYTKPMEYFLFLYKKTGKAKWLHKVFDTMNAYKAQLFLRDKIINQLSKGKEGDIPLFKEYLNNDHRLGIAIFEKDTLEAGILESDTLSLDKLVAKQVEINTLLRQKENLKNSLKVDNTDLFDKVINVKAMSIDQVMEYCSKNNIALVMYYIGDTFYNADKIYALMVCHGKLKYQVLKNDTQLTNNIDSLYAIHERQDIEYDSSSYRAMSIQVFNQVFEPVLDNLEGMKNIVIIPDEKLHHLSFEALIMDSQVEEMSELTDNDLDPYVIDSFNVTYSYSTNRFMDRENTNHVKYKCSALGMGFSSRETILNSKLDSLPELTSSFEEVATIEKSNTDRNARYFTGFECTKKNFFKYAPEARLIHLSTHGGFETKVKRSGMIFFRNGESVDELYQHELRFANVSPEVLVLSACDSGAGELNNEEGMMSLGRIFQAYGTQKVISALWPLTDRASTDLFDSFYSYYYKDQENVSTALRNAKLKLLHSNSDFSFPGYWAGVILYN